jgi:sulfur-oxidizing protein SoxX
MKKTLISALVATVFAGSAFAMSEKTDTAAAGGFSATQLAAAEALVGNSWTQATDEERKRLVQDETLKLCSTYKDKPPVEIAQQIVAMNKAITKYPEGGIKLGDWKEGEKLANSGYGMRIGSIKPDKNKNRPNGGNCYACHVMGSNQPAAGNLGPSLANYGARGTSEPMLKYTYEKIYNAQAFFACSNMPRFGMHGVLTDKQIADIMAFMFDPNSPVNKK